MIHRGFGPHTTAMAMHNTLNNGQTYTCASKFFQTVQPLKNAKQSIRILDVKSRAVIANPKNVFAVLVGTIGFNNSRFHAMRAFDRIA